MNLPQVFLFSLLFFSQPVSTSVQLQPLLSTTASIDATSTIPMLITKYAKQYNVSEEVMNKVISCESSYRADALGDGGLSRGLVQIHKPSHPTITDEQAYDPEFAIDFLAKNLAKNKGSMWTCYRIMVDT